MSGAVTGHGLPILYALFLWWFSTGAILYLDGLPRRTFRWSLLGATGLGVLCFYGLAASAEVASVPAAYAAFSCAVGLWGWNEIAFLMGFVTGPRREACPEDCGGWAHFGHAAATLLWHELAIALSALGVAALTWGAPNQAGLWTFVVLWGMRLSAKLNLFLGVPNLNEDLLPEHLRYLERYLTRRPMNLLFPASVTVATAVTVGVFGAAFDAGASAFEAVAWTFVGTMLALALLEHWLMVLPLPSAALWAWSFRSRRDAEASESGVRFPAP